MSTARDPPAGEFIERAYNLLRRPTWQGDLGQALLHPIHGKIILAVARNMETRAKAHPPPEPSYLGVSRAFSPRSKEPTPLRFDRKRLASGEKEDDDSAY